MPSDDEGFTGGSGIWRPGTGIETGDSVNPLISVAFLVRAVRRRPLVLLAAGLIGLLAGLGLSILSPPSYSATTVLLLRHPDQADPLRAMQTDSLLVTTRTVAQRAADDFDLQVPANELVGSYQAFVLSQDLLQLRATAPSSREAVRRTAALSDAYLAFRSEEVQRQAELSIAALEEREEGLTTELADVSEQIGDFPVGPNPLDAAASTRFADLNSRRGTIISEIAQLRQNVDSFALDARAVTSRSRVVDPAVAQARSPLRTAIRNIVTGILAGLMLGLAWLIFQSATSDRLRRREDVVGALGAPVALSLGAIPHRRFGGRRRLRASLTDPSPGVAAIVGHLHEVLVNEDEPRPDLVVLSVRSDAAAALAVASLALQLAQDRENVLLVDLTPETVLTDVLGLKPGTGNTAVQLPEGNPVRVISPLSAGGRPSPDQFDVGRLEHLDVADVVLVLATIDPAIGADHVRGWARTAVAVVTAGRSTATALRSTGRIVRLAGIGLDSAVLLGADADDETAGVIDRWQPGLQRATAQSRR